VGDDGGGRSERVLFVDARRRERGGAARHGWREWKRRSSDRREWRDWG